jgi:hypothetical protein
MKTVFAAIALLTVIFVSSKPKQQAPIKYANVEIDAKTPADWLRRPIKNIEPAQANSGNAFYVTEGTKIKLYVMDELPKPLNATEIMAAVEAAQGQTNGKVNEDKMFNLNNRTPNGEMNIDLWGHSRKVADVNGKQVTLITADQIYIAPNIRNDLFFDFIGANYLLKQPEMRKVYLVFNKYNQIPANFPNRIWTEGTSSVVKVGMGAPEVQQIKVRDINVNIGQYPRIGYIDLAQTTKAKIQDVPYLVKYQVEGSPLKMGVYINIKFPGDPNYGGPWIQFGDPRAVVVNTVPPSTGEN